MDYKIGEGVSDDNGLNVMIITEDNPSSFEETIKSNKYGDAMVKEMESIEKNKVWELTNLSIEVKWIFKTKFKENGEINKFKARLVAKRYVQQYGVEYT